MQEAGSTGESGEDPGIAGPQRRWTAVIDGDTRGALTPCYPFPVEHVSRGNLLPFESFPISKKEI